MLNQVKDIEERARMHSEEMLDFVQLVNFIIQSFAAPIQYIVELNRSPLYIIST